MRVSNRINHRENRDGIMSGPRSSSQGSTAVETDRGSFRSLVARPAENPSPTQAFSLPLHDMAPVPESCQPLWKLTRRKFDRLHSRLPGMQSFELGRLQHHHPADNHGARRSIWRIHWRLGLLHLYLHPAGTASMLLQAGYREELRSR